MRGGQPSSSTTSPEVRRLLQQTQALESQLKQAIPKGSVALEEVEELRNKVREHYVRLLFADPAFASGRDLEQSLWKTCFHKKIEEYRKRIRKYAATASTSDNRAAVTKAKADLHAVCNDFSNFITDSITFYQDLMSQYETLRKQWPTRRQSLVEGAEAAGHTSSKSQLSYDPLRSIHRCLIFLGDLARYRELHSESSRKDWSQAEKWYYQAIDTLPANGNPHNQLAVLATYTEAECVAVYRYCRALLCEQPFPTAKENLALLFEKNKQNMVGPAAREAETSGEEERLRQGLLSGTITGQQAGIARATMLKMFLQRFVRLHGMLFSELSNQELSPSLPFSVPDFLGMLDTALADLRQLLKMSAFGDGLLLHMVIICIYSAITANDQGSSIHQQDDTAIEEDSIPCLSLSLAFGVVAEIASCVRTTRQDAEHTTAKPPGSRLLGPVVVFVDWLTTRPPLWRLKPIPMPNGIGGGPDRAAKTKEAALREAFWASLARIATELQAQLRPQGSLLPASLVWEPEDGRVLKEQHDLRGFEPLNAVYGYDLMTRPKSELGRLDIVSDDLAASWRTLRLTRMLEAMGAQTGVVQVVKDGGGRGDAIIHFRVSPDAKEPIVAAPGSRPTSMGLQRNGVSSTAGSNGAASSSSSSFLRRMAGYGSNGADENGLSDEGDDMIVFKPAYAARPLGEPAHHHLPGGVLSGPLDDSSQLPKDVVESMLGGLLDCSDSGPKPLLSSLHSGSSAFLSSSDSTSLQGGDKQPSPSSLEQQQQRPTSPFLSDLTPTAKPFFSNTPSLSKAPSWQTQPPTPLQQQPSPYHHQQLPVASPAPAVSRSSSLGSMAWATAPASLISTSTTSTTTASSTTAKDSGSSALPSWSAFSGSDGSSLMPAPVAPPPRQGGGLSRAGSFTPPPPGFEAPSPPPPSSSVATGFSSGGSIFGSGDSLLSGGNGYDPFGPGQHNGGGPYPTGSLLQQQQQQQQQQQAGGQRQPPPEQLSTKNPFFTPATGFMFRAP